MKWYGRKKSSLLILVMLWGGLEPKAAKDEGEKDFTQGMESQEKIKGNNLLK